MLHGVRVVSRGRTMERPSVLHPPGARLTREGCQRQHLGCRAVEARSAHPLGDRVDERPSEGRCTRCGSRRCGRPPDRERGAPARDRNRARARGAYAGHRRRDRRTVAVGDPVRARPGAECRAVGTGVHLLGRRSRATARGLGNRAVHRDLGDGDRERVCRRHRRTTPRPAHAGHLRMCAPVRAAWSRG